MDSLDLNTILNRNNIAIKVKNFLINFDKNKQDFNNKRGLYIYGSPGIGKTEFITNILKELQYDIIRYDAGDIRNKSIIDTITKHNMSDKNIFGLFYKRNKSIAIVMDEIDGMNNGDKGGINSLIKVIRPKKTKKQKTEEISHNPIICISNYHIDKKIKELMKVCINFELKAPTISQVNLIIGQMFEKIRDNPKIISNINLFIKGDLRKLNSIYKIYIKDERIVENNTLETIFQSKSINEDTKEITKNLINNKYRLEDHNILMNETDRTIVGLLYHENIIDVLSHLPNRVGIPLYIKLLDNICFADYIDRITFQKQIWQFNEMSSLLKIFYNNKIFHETLQIDLNSMDLQTAKKMKLNDEMRFTKILTKYSTEYNNSLFIQNLCQELGLDKKDMFGYFLTLKTKNTIDEIYNNFENYEISKLDINRIYRYLDKYLVGISESDSKNYSKYEEFDEFNNLII